MKCKQQKTNRVGAENKIQTYKLGDEQLKKKDVQVGRFSVTLVGWLVVLVSCLLVEWLVGLAG